MLDSIIKKDYNVGGIKVHVYTSTAALLPSVAVVFLLHGRLGAATGVDMTAKTLLEKVDGKEHDGSLYIVTLVSKLHLV